MALKATIYKVDLNIANMDSHQYGDYQFTMALHPSETIERLMVRILAYAKYVDDGLEFTKDLFETNEPALWEKDLTGQLVKWIEVGMPDEDKVKKAAARCQQVSIVTYGSSVDEWYKRNSKLKTLRNVEVWQLTPETTAAIQVLCQRTMQLQLNVMDGEWTLLSDHGQAAVEWIQLQ
ncbi:MULTISPECIES: YaeQ family protein [unclassified Acinetobacter]|uniref:YaeQ family protein n=1 Tax=unclassified Acinetobacter TaxID=196816 RepID=UPI00293507C0|nr:MULTISPECIES: YaeQ family protein [unclassified Acinetobacter]WOE32714.1 YaeQ family protein [Acinetobacter sp. SAAs470]WOE38190.1 YaeQ family protein [Acinetobacter sp. SAAs474]